MVTAGHCVRGPKPIEWVRAGGHLVQDERAGQSPQYGSQLPPYQQQRINEEDIIVHEGYGQKGNNIVDDIALIRLPERVQTNKGTQFACMPLPNNASYAALQVNHKQYNGLREGLTNRIEFSQARSRRPPHPRPGVG